MSSTLTLLSEPELKEVVRSVFKEELSNILSKDSTEERMLDKKQTCDLLNIGFTTLRNLRLEGKLTPRPIKGKMLYRYTDILNYIENLI